jgi:hypothetical protein
VSGQEFDEFAALWTEEPDAEEKRIFKSLARMVSRRAKLLHYINLGLALFLIIGMIIAMSLDPKPATLALVVLALAALGWSAWKRYQLFQVALIVDFRNREAMLASAAESVEGRLRQARLTFAGLIPCFFAGLALRGTVGSSLEQFMSELLNDLTKPLTLGGAVVVALMMIYFGRQVMRLKRELKHLTSLQLQYRSEASLDGED